MHHILKNQISILLCAMALGSFALGCGKAVRVVGTGGAGGAGGGGSAGTGEYPEGSGSEGGGEVGGNMVVYRNNVIFEGEPRLWVHGIPTAPQLAADINAGGIRGIVDLRNFTPKQYVSMLEKYAEFDLGFCLTVRWEAPKIGGEKRTGGERIDIPPTDEEATRSIQDVIDFFNHPAAKKLSGKIWIQFYNEISGGPGRFGVEEEDAMFAYATRLAKRLRDDAPHVKICGPALTGIDVLANEDDSKLTGIPKLRYQRLVRTLRWSAEYADAVDLHLHAEDGPWAAQEIRLVRRVLDRQEGGKDTAIVSFEWSCARFKNRDDQQAVRNVLGDIWRVMTENNVVIAAYGAYWPGQNQRELYQWKSLVDRNGQPNEPFYTFFKKIATEQRRRSGSEQN